MQVTYAPHDRRHLRRRDIFAGPSIRWADPRAQLLDGTRWASVRGEVLTGLSLTETPDRHLGVLARELDAAWRLLADRMAEAGQDGPVRLVPDGDGRIRLAVDRLEAIGEPESLVSLRAVVTAMLPRVDLPELLLEVHGWTGFLGEYTHVGGHGPRMEGMPVSVAALLVAEACNVGLTPVTDPNNPALTRGRLSHVDQNYVRADTHAAPNARLVEAQASIPVAGLWGGGLVASADGLRFTVPVQTINALPSPRYFGHGRGVTWLNAINDQVAGIGAVVVPGTMRDPLHILDTMLNMDAGPKPEMIATDTASYGPLNALARHRVSLAKIREHWDDMLRIAGSLVTSQVRAYDLLRMLGRDGHPTALGQALAEYGRIAKTLHLLAFADPADEAYRRTVHRQLTIQESRHRLARKIFHGQRGELRQAYREGQEDQLGALGLVLNAVVLWNTRYTDAALGRLRGNGQEVASGDAARLSPLVDAHINMLGRYAFTQPPCARCATPGRRPRRTDR